MAKKLRRAGQLSAKANEMRNLALKASEATHGFGKINPIEMAMSWTNAQNVVSPWGRGIKSSVAFYKNHAEDFPIATEDLNSFIKDAAEKAKNELGLNATPDIHIGYGIEEDLMRGTGGGNVYGRYNHKWKNRSSYIEIFPDSMWDRVKKSGGDVNDLLKQITDTVSHEMRHMYQYEGNDIEKWSGKNNKYKKKHGMEPGDRYPDFKTYYNDPIEKDARKYGKKFQRRNIKDLKNDLKNRQSRLAEITQQKLREERRSHPFRRGEGTWRIADNNFDYGPAEFDLNGLNIPNNSVDIQDSGNYRQLKKGQGTYRVKPKGPQIGDNFFDTSGKQMVLAGTETTRGGSTMYQFITEQGDQFYTTSLEGYKNYTGNKPIKADVAKNYANKWRELQALEGEYWNNRRNNPNWSVDDRLKFFKEKVDPVKKSLYGYKSRMEKYLGHKTGFSEFNESRYITHFAKGEKEFLTKEKNKKKKQQTQQTQSGTAEGSTNKPTIRDLDKKTLANLTDEEIREWAQNSGDYDEAVNLRRQARKDLGMDPIPEIDTTGKNTGTETKLNNNFRGNTTNTNTNTGPYIDKNLRNLQAGDTIDINTGIVTKADGRQVYPDGRVFNADGSPYTPPETSTNTSGGSETSTNTSGGPQPEVEETLDEKIKRLTEEQKKKFEEESEAEFKQKMKDIEDEYNAESKRIEEQFKGTHSETPDVDVDPNGKMTLKEYMDQRHKDIESRRPLTRSQKLSRAKSKLKGKTGKQLAKGSKQAIKARNMKGKKFKVSTKVKGGNFKQLVASTLVSAATESVEKEVFRMHPDMFDDLDKFADLTDDDIRYFSDMIFDPDETQSLKKQKVKEWKDKRKQAKDNRAKTEKQKIIDNPDDYMDSFMEDYRNRAYGNYSGEQTINGYKFNGKQGNYDPNYNWRPEDYKNPDTYTMDEMEFEVDENGKTKMNKTGNKKEIEIEQNKKARMKTGGSGSTDDIFSWMKKHGVGIAEGLNILSSISTYKENRKQGRSVASSAVRAAGSFVAGEVLGFWGYIGLQAAVGLPKLAIKGAEMLYKENRKMNSAANQQVFGGAQFADNQQLATMRQSGMEMAKMAQYNLQQTLMGNEATYLHR